jgi:hypothetical protein
MTGWVAAGLLALALQQQNPFDCAVLLGSAKRLCLSEPWTAECRTAQGAWIGSFCSEGSAIFERPVAPTTFTPPFSFEGEVDRGFYTREGFLVSTPPSDTIAIFGHKPRATGILDDMDYRCALIVSRDKKNGWLIDRKENTAVRVDGQELPDWCSE